MITEILKIKKRDVKSFLITHINNNFMSLFNTVKFQQPTCDKVNQNKLPCAFRVYYLWFITT